MPTGSSTAFSAERTQLRDQFMQITAQLKTADPLAQAAVGHGINMVHSFFVRRFGDVSAFQRHSKTENLRFIDQLSELERKLGASDPHTALGVILFKMWIGAVSEKDQDLIDEFSAELAALSRRGESLGGSP